MCGIAGIFEYMGRGKVNQEELLRVRDRMRDRGPDGAGEWFSRDGEVGLAHRRLSIIDLSETGSQPMVSEDGNLVVVFNGEIYNYRELRASLEMRGCRFRSTSDTEILLHLFREKGMDMLRELRGMYAFAIWDEREKALFLARDPFGIKPMYYADDGIRIRFASQVKALLVGGGIDTSLDPSGTVGYFLWGYVPEPYTLYRGIRELPAGSWLRMDSSGRRNTGIFCSIEKELTVNHAAPPAMPREVMRKRLREALLDSVRHHLIADVPVGVFLSSGLDSTTLTALCSEVSPSSVNTVTLGFREYYGREEDEVPLAEQVAETYGTCHRTIWVEKTDFQAEVPRLIDAMDQATVDGVNSYFVSLAAARAGLKVALSGLGGDELFGSYPSFTQVPRMVKMAGPIAAVPFLGKTFRAVAAPFLKSRTSPKYAGLLEYGGSFGGAYLLRRGMFMPWELPEFLDGEVVREGWRELRQLSRLEATVAGNRSDYHRISALEMCWYMRNQLLRDCDWTGMAHSLEIRVPMVDVELLRAVSPMLGTADALTKRDMAMMPEKLLPESVMSRRKTGFSVPVREWISEDAPYSGERGLRGWTKQVYAAYLGSAEVATIKKSTARRKGTGTVVIFRIGQLGDTLVAMPAIDAIRRKYPRHRLVLLTDRYPLGSGFISSWDLLGPTGWFDEVQYYSPTDDFRGRLGNMTLLARKLRRMGPDIIYNLAPDRTALQQGRDRFFFRQLVGAKNYIEEGPTEKAGMDRNGRTDGLPRMEPEWKRLLVTVGGIENPLFHLSIPEKAKAQALRVLMAEGVFFEGKVIAVGPGSKMLAKRWPVERFAAVGKRLLEMYPDLSLAILGGGEDVEIGNQLCQGWGERSHNLAGKLSVYGSAAILERCIAYLGNDTGTMHLAAMVGVPCIAIFSARDYPGKWEPYGDHHIVFRRDVDCAKCMREVCLDRGNDCLMRIEVEEVFAAGQQMLEGGILRDRKAEAP